MKSLNKSISKVVLSQKNLALTEFFEKTVKIYGIELVSLDMP